MRTVPLGAGVLAGTAVALLVIGYLAIYLLSSCRAARWASAMAEILPRFTSGESSAPNCCGRLASAS
jgi:hypothetical protein